MSNLPVLTEGHIRIYGCVAAGVSVAHITTRDHEDVSWEHMDVQGPCRTGSVPHWLWRFGQLGPPLTCCAPQESSPAPCLDSTVELALVVGCG